MFLPIRAYDNYINANMHLGLLQEAGIDCHLKDEYTITIDPLLSPALGGMKLMVDEKNVPDAVKLLDEAEQIYLQTVPCPACREKRLVFVKETITHPGWAGKLKSILLNGQEQEIKTFYRCDHCQASFPQLPQ